MEIKKVAVVGAGTMGNQIAIQVAISGYKTVCYDINAESLKKAEAFSDSWFEKRVAKGKMTAEQAEGLRKNLTFSGDIKLAADETDIVIEAVADEVEIKRLVLHQIDEFTPDRCIYASNSSYIVSSKFCDAVKDPSKVLNMHFFNPALVMRVVEVVKGPHVSDETFNTVFEFTKSIDKDPYKIEKEIYGFCVNRIFSTLSREALYLVDMGIATPEDIDSMVKGALGHKMGPLETLDMTGIDLAYSIAMEKFRTTGDKADLPAACIATRYAKGEYGRKSGKGFYEYEEK